MAASKTTAPAEQYDFDNWSEDKEAAALKALVPDIKHIIVEGSFVGRFPDGAIVKLPLKLSLDDVDGFGAGDTVDQFKELLKTLGGEDAAKEFSSHDIVETTVMAERYFAMFQKISKAALPE